MALFDFLSYNNGYLPETTKQVVGLSRDPRKNKINQYIQYVPTKKPTAYYTRIERDAFLRRSTTAKSLWADGDVRPLNNGNKLRHKVVSVDTMRTNFSWTLGYQAINNSDLYQVRPAHVNLALSQAMLERYNVVYNLIETAGNYTITDTATNYGGGKWDAGTRTAPYFMKGLLNIANEIYKATAGVVEVTDLVCLLSPPAAIKIGASEEMRTWYANSSLADKVTANPHGIVNRQWGLPDEYGGVRIIVEGKQYTDTVQDALGTDNATVSYYKTDDNAIILARVGGIDGVPGETPFSSVQMFFYGDEDQKSARGSEKVDGTNLMMAVKVFDDPENERVAGHVSQQQGVNFTCTESAAYATDILT